MNLQEKYVYHQIHPLKLFTDWTTGLLALYPLWQHNLLTAILIAFIPPPIVSFLLIRFADLEKYKASLSGQYNRKTMICQMEAIWFAGYAAMAVGAWINSIWLIFSRLVVILFGRLRGKNFIRYFP